MYAFTHAGRGLLGLMVRHWLMAVLLAWVAPVEASCLQSADAGLARLQQMVGEDASKALKESQSALDALKRDPGTNRFLDAERAAALYAVQAEAYGILELDADARRAASKGLELATDVHDPVHLQLLSAYGDAVFEKASISGAIEAIEAARVLQPHGSLAETCLLISRGLLEYRQERTDLAIVTLTQAYRASISPIASEAHIRSAEFLSVVMRSMGDYPQALALNQEKIDWDSEHGAVNALSVSRFMRGQIYKLMHNYRAAIAEYEQARKLSVSLNDLVGVAFADQTICESHIELDQLGLAERECTSARHIFATTHVSDALKETEALLARVDLESGHPERALATLNRVLDHGGADISPRHVAPIYQWRARTSAALHDYRNAYDDLREYIALNTEENDAERTRQVSAQRARFETDREVERNAALQRELELSKEQAHRQAQQLRWNTVAVVLGALVITLLIYFLLANRTYRARLVQLAREDSLTGLPNRRSTAELAEQALRAASNGQRPLTLAVIDMDHFKDINDRCGHAAGDTVLREFARAGREALRESDILGRWGGEEFLLVMPDTPLELALASLERLRTLVFNITLPPSGRGLRVSMSAGLASLDESTHSLDELIAQADAALYTAKNEGRDLIRIAEEHSSAPEPREGLHALS
jgi:diguanylate cyclase (GGDEF)-like protein